MDHYSKLSAEAARRERKALWRVQRHRLADARRRFLLEEEKRVQGMLGAVSEGKPPEPLAVLPGACSQVRAAPRLGAGPVSPLPPSCILV